MIDKNTSAGYVRAGANVKGKKVYDAEFVLVRKIDEDNLIPTNPSNVSTLTTGELAKQQGFTGDMCSNCGGSHMQVAGHCYVCADCGTTTGCS